MKITYDDDTIKSMIEELRLYEVFSSGIKTEFGKTLIGLIDSTIQHTEMEWMNKGLSQPDNELISLRYAIRSKLQTLKSLKSKLMESESEKRRLQVELNSIGK